MTNKNWKKNKAKQKYLKQKVIKWQKHIKVQKQTKFKMNFKKNRNINKY